MSLCDILYFVPVLPALSSLPTLPGHVLGRCQKKSGQGQQSQLALGQLTLVPASAALCADVGISRVHLNRKLKEFGAEWGVGVGMTSQCYAIPTMDGSIDIIRKHVDDFTAYAKAHPELTFLVTRIGCGIAGWRDSEIASLFKEASELDNVTLPEELWNALGL